MLFRSADVVAVAVGADNPFGFEVVVLKLCDDALALASRVDNEGTSAVTTEDVAVGFKVGYGEFVKYHFRGFLIR